MPSKEQSLIASLVVLELMEFCMSSGSDSSQRENYAPAGSRPEELPPVTPPSAGYIVQLFLIPALIVMAVVAVWALFGKLADSESDWQQLVAELGSSNEHRRWRAALGLAQILRNEEITPPEDREPLAQHPLVIDSLTDLLSQSLKTQTPSEEDVSHQEYLARTLGALNADEKTLPVLAEAAGESYNVEVRKSALMSIAVIAGRRFDALTGYSAKDDKTTTSAETKSVPLETPTISNEAVLKQLKLCAQDKEPVVRHLAGFAIGNAGGPYAVDLLKVMLLDGDRFARANAAVGLARNGSTDGVPVLTELLNESLLPFDASTLKGKTANEIQLAENNFLVEQPSLVRTCLRAVSDLWPRLSDAQKTELKTVLEKISAEFFAPQVRIQADELLREIAAP